MAKKPWECCNYPTLSVKTEILDSCNQKCTKNEELEEKKLCYRECVLRESGIIVDMRFSGENFQKLFSEDPSETVMSETWQSVVKQSVSKCESESKIKGGS